MQKQQFQRLQRAANQNRCHLAAKLGERYCRLNPNHSPAWLFYGRSLAAIARYDEARVALQRCLETAPPERYATIYAQLGHLEALAGDFPAAEAWYHKAFDAAAPDEVERLYLSEILYRQGKLQEAESIFRRVVATQNESKEQACHLLGEILASQCRYREAMDAFQQAAEAAPTRPKHARRLRELKRIVRLDESSP
ncbi:MAG: tetratricopeptide repeat protein [Planctomycetota bacterium]|nr:tetratricopeptide repeat protein [Planctomycetota bacterium]